MTSPVEPRDQEVAARLRRLRVDPPDDGFMAALHRRVAEAPPPPPPSLLARLVEAWRAAPRLSIPAAAGLAAAAALAVFALRAPQAGLTPAERAALASAAAQGGPAGQVAQAAPQPEGDAPARPVVSVPATQVALVRLDLSVTVAVASADVRITLPDGLVFWSRGQALPDRTFEWSQALAAGRNEIPIAVRGQQPGLYHLTVTARVDGEWISHDVPLQVTAG